MRSHKNKTSNERETIYPGTREAWRKWLSENHERTTGIWLIIDKKGSGKRELAVDAVVEEALCFGWIDSTANKLDDDRFKLSVGPRKPKSVWSKVNKQRVERLIAAGLMMPPGLAKIEEAKRNGSWNALDEVENLIVPADLQEALEANTSALKNFSAFSNSSRKIILGWIASAKRAETRAKRIGEAVRLAAENVKANHYRR